MRLLAGIALVAVLSACGADGSSSLGVADPTSGPGSQRPTPCSLPEAPAGPACGLTEAQLRDLNLQYAERGPFRGDPERLVDALGRVRAALSPLRSASREALVAALVGAGFSSDQVVTSDNAVRAPGLAYAVELGDGCVFGAFEGGRFTVASGGFVRDGGCLASYGH